MPKKISKNEIPSLLGKGLRSIVNSEGGLLIQEYWDRNQREAMLKKLYAKKTQWQFYPGHYKYHSFGNALYGYRSRQQIDDYFRSAPESLRLVRESFPDLEEEMRHPIKILEHPSEVSLRDGHAGPGFIIQDDESTHSPHFDLNEALLPLLTLFPRDDLIYTAVGMLKKPDSGGRLHIWNRSYDFTLPYEAQIDASGAKPDWTIDYPEGGLLIVNGLLLHEIEASQGERISVNGHFLRTKAGGWTYWF